MVPYEATSGYYLGQDLQIYPMNQILAKGGEKCILREVIP